VKDWRGLFSFSPFQIHLVDHVHSIRSSEMACVVWAFEFDVFWLIRFLNILMSVLRVVLVMGILGKPCCSKRLRSSSSVKSSSLPIVFYKIVAIWSKSKKLLHSLHKKAGANFNLRFFTLNEPFQFSHWIWVIADSDQIWSMVRKLIDELSNI
jgi:hypothetical protein